MILPSSPIEELRQTEEELFAVSNHLDSLVFSKHIHHHYSNVLPTCLQQQKYGDFKWDVFSKLCGVRFLVGSVGDLRPRSFFFSGDPF